MFRRLFIVAILAVLSSCATQSTTPAFDATPLALINPQTVDDRVLTGGQPSADDLAYLKSQGFGAVINLRTAEEDLGYDEAAEAEKLGLAYVNVPVSTSKGLDAATAAYLRSVINQTQAPVLVHCGSGNRVGALYAIGAHFIDGMSIEDALTVGRSAGLTRFEPTVREIIEGGSVD